MTHRLVALALAAATLAACTSTTSAPSDSATAGEQVVASTIVDAVGREGDFGVVDGQPSGPVVAPVRHPATGHTVYFVMPDRFANGDPTNDDAGLGPDPLVSGHLPTDTGFHHGGDLAGLTQRLDYLADLGVDAIWITPPFTNRFVQGDGTVEGSSSSYHGYWQIDWDHIDPHLGTEDDMAVFVDAAHERNMAVYFDIVVNQTGDVISYDGGATVYRSTSAAPYLDAQGRPFALDDLGSSEVAPVLDPAISFPYVPLVAAADAAVKSPAWLNDVTLYHNRGNSTFQGESSELGDFFGLDDLFTEHPVVVERMTELQASLIARFGINGFRIDTMKHVDIGFWESFAPIVTAAATTAGTPDFFMFGEVFSEDPILQSSYTNVGISATLDFIFSAALDGYVAKAGSGSQLAAAFDDDDWFTDADNNASMQVKFFGNHDMGRMGHLINRANPGAGDAELLARMELGFDLLFLTRGVPVVYYGDEQGFVGDGGDQLARQSMFPSLAPTYLDDDNIGSEATPADDNFDTTHPLFRRIAELDALRATHPGLVSGAQITHDTDGPVFAFSRIDRDERIEYVVLTNSNGSLRVPSRFEVLSPGTTFESMLAPDPITVTSDGGGELFVQVPPLSTIVLQATSPLAPPSTGPSIDVIRPADGAEIPTPRYRLEAVLDDRRFAEVTFAVAVDGGDPVIVGVDDAAPYRVYWDNRAAPTGSTVDIFATVADGSGRTSTAIHTVTMGDRT